MRRYSARLRFSEDELKQRTVRKAAEKADRAADRADKAKAKLKASRKLTRETAANAARKGKLVQAGEIKNPANSVRAPLEATRSAVSRTVHRQASEHQEDNVGIQSANASTEAAETAVEFVSHHAYSQKLRKYDKAAKLERAVDKANVNAIYEARKTEVAQSGSNPISRWRQKRNIQKEYAAAKRAGHRVYDTGKTAEYAKEAAKKTRSVVSRIGSYAAEYSHVLLIVLLIGGVAATISGAFSSCGAMGSGGTHAILASSFTAADEDILGANEDYHALEQELQARINNIETDYPDYDEYVYNLAEINHNPYELISYLTVRFEDFHREQVQDALQQVFSAQYELSTVESVEMRTRTVTETDPETGEETTREEEYEYHILTVTLRNHGIAAVLNYAGFTESQIQRYRLLIESKGKADIFTKRTIRPTKTITSADTPSEALAISIGERGKVDLPYMSELLGAPGDYEPIIQALHGVIFKNPMAPDDLEQGWQTADEYLSGNVRDKLRIARLAAEKDAAFTVNVEALEKAQPKDLDASEIDVRLGATWIDSKYIQQFMVETFDTPFYLRRNIQVQ